jgi:hypothetical protein
MKKIFIAATIILVTGFSYKYNSKAQAEVNKIDGLYLFIEATPVNAYEQGLAMGWDLEIVSLEPMLNRIINV